MASSEFVSVDDGLCLSRGRQNAVCVDAIAHAGHHQTLQQLKLIDRLHVRHQVGGRVEDGHGDLHVVNGVVLAAFTSLQVSGEGAVCIWGGGERRSVLR